jgi:hypothetical protein
VRLPRDGGTGRRGHDRDCPAPAFPNLITHMATNGATVTDNQMTGAIDDELAAKTLRCGMARPFHPLQAPAGLSPPTRYLSAYP